MQTRAMQEMHAKMMAAKTPQERQALRSEPMKVMQDGMAMMGRMHAGSGARSGAGMGGGMSTSPRTMGKRMDMMETMMLDREAPSPAGR